MEDRSRWKVFTDQVALSYEEARRSIRAGQSKGEAKAKYARAVAEAWGRLWEEVANG